jgi:ELWxxDGT repeat protein
MVRDLDPSNNWWAWNTGPTQLTAMGNKVFFWSNDGTDGRELWVSDGSAAGTTLVKDINPGPGDSDPGTNSNCLAVVGSTLFFAANDGVTGTELWKTDGTAAGTVLVKDINPGTNGSGPTSLTSFNGKVYFSADDGTNGRQLWVSDGTTDGTAMVNQANAFGSVGPHQLTVLGGALYFLATSSNGAESLWVTDGTTAGSSKLRDVAPPPQPDVGPAPLGSAPESQALYTAGGTLFFTAVTPGEGRELWTTDGTADGTTLVRDIRPGPAGSQINFLGRDNGKVLFTADDGQTGDELWASDGTREGTKQLSDINQKGVGSKPTAPVEAGSQLFFVADDGVHGRELWVDGPFGARMVKDINPGVWTSGSGTGDALPASSNIHELVAAGNHVFFVADDGVHGQALWVSNGSALGTHMIAGVNGAEIDDLTLMDNRAFFVADDGVHGRELWVSDGTAAGTQMVSDINATAAGQDDTGQAITAASDPSDLVVLNDRLYFAADDGVHGRELWVSDGTADGTTMLANINPETVDVVGNVGPEQNSNPTGLTVVGSAIYFSADNGRGGMELWRTDGTPAGTQQILNINQIADPNRALGSTLGSNPTDFVGLGNEVLFVANDGVNGPALWETDGTHDGTSMIRAFNGTDLPGGPIAQLTVVGNSVFFEGDTTDTGAELWVTDGTTAGTHLVKDIKPGTYHNPGDTSLTPFGSNPQYLTAFDGKLYFVGHDGIHGGELWTSDGTDAGTTMVADIKPGAAGGLATTSGLVATSNGLIFSAGDSVHGMELWKFTPDATSA